MQMLNLKGSKLKTKLTKHFTHMSKEIRNSFTNMNP